MFLMLLVNAKKVTAASPPDTSLQYGFNGISFYSRDIKDWG